MIKTDLKRLVITADKKVRVLYTYKEDEMGLKLKAQHGSYLTFMKENFYPSIFTHAYVSKRSIYTNAIVHLNNNYFVKIDVKNFFPSLSHKILIKAMYEELNRKNKNAITINECAEILSNSSIDKIGLPLGLLTSPMLSNIYMKKFDTIFYGKLKQLDLEGVLYTRYADDIFVSFKSTSNNLSSTDAYKVIIDQCKQILSSFRLKINHQKTKTIDLNKSNHVKIAGVNLIGGPRDDRRLTISRSVVKDLYFETMSINKKLLESNTIDDMTVNRIKGMHSFILSIEKRGYSHVLSDKMRKSITHLGYKNLEHMIASLNNNHK